jgi:hypothetical protein
MQGPVYDRCLDSTKAPAALLARLLAGQLLLPQEPLDDQTQRPASRDFNSHNAPKVTRSQAVQPSRDQQCALTTGSDELNLNPPW